MARTKHTARRPTGSKKPSTQSHQALRMLAGGHRAEDDEKTEPHKPLHESTTSGPPENAEKSGEKSAQRKRPQVQLPERVEDRPQDKELEEGGDDGDDQASAVAQGTSSSGAGSAHVEAQPQINEQCKKRRKG